MSTQPVKNIIAFPLSPKQIHLFKRSLYPIHGVSISKQKGFRSCYVLSISDHKGTTSYTGRRCKEALKPDLFLTHDSYHPQPSNRKEHAP